MAAGTPQSVGSSQHVTGEVIARSPDGSERVLKTGDTLYNTDTIITRTGGTLTFKLQTGQQVEVVSGRIFSLADFIENKGWEWQGEPGVQEMQELLASEQDPFKELPATASGSETDDAGGEPADLTLEDIANLPPPTAGQESAGGTTEEPIILPFEIRQVTPETRALGTGNGDQADEEIDQIGDNTPGSAPDNAPSIAVTANNLREDSGVVAGDVAGTYTTADEEGDALTVSFTPGSNSSGHYVLANGRVELTEVGAAAVNRGEPLDPIDLTVTQNSDPTLTGSDSDTPVVTAIDDAPIINVVANDFTEDSGVAPGDIAGTYTTTDEEGDALTVSFTQGSNSNGHYVLANGRVELTDAGAAAVNRGEPLDPIDLTVAQINDSSLTGSDSDTPTVTAVNDAPVPDSNEINVDEESTGTSLGLSAPTDRDGDNLTITVTGLPALGAVTLANGTAISNGQTLSAAQLTGLQYNAPDEYNGSDSVGNFTYSVDDGQGEANSVQSGGVSITVNPVNDAPVPDSNELNVDEESTGTPLGISAPTDNDGDSLNITVTGLPLLGEVTLANGTAISNGQTLSAAQLTGLQYNAPDEYNGSDPVGNFTYSVDDGQGEANSVQSGGVSISVNPVNDAPVPDSNEINVNEESTGTPLGLSTPTDNDGDSLTIIVTGLPLLGEVTLANGSAISNGQTLSAVQLTGLQYNAPDEYNGSDPVGNFTYSVDDGQGEANSVQSGGVSISVNPINDAPVPDSNEVNVDEESSGTPLGLSAPTDRDGDNLTITVTGLPALGAVTLANGTAISNGQTLSAAQLTGLQYNAPDEYNGSDPVGNFTYSVDDGQGEANSVQGGGVSISVNPVNDAPVPDSNEINVNEESTGTPLGLSAPTDSDGDSLTITVTGLPVLGVVTLANGTAVSSGQTLSAAQITGLQYNAPDEYNGSDPVGNFTYSVDDGQGEANSVQSGGVSISVNPINDAPVPDSNEVNVDEESSGTPLGLSAPTDRDGDNLTITVTGLPALGAVTLANGTAISNGQTLSAAQLTGLQYNAPDEYNGSDPVGNFTYSVDDGQGEANSVQSGGVSITVNPVNDAPVLDSNELNVDEESTGTPLGISAPTDNDGDSLNITVTGLPLLGEVTLANGTAISNGQTLSAAQLTGLQYNAPDEYNGSDPVGNFTYSVDDGQGEANSVQSGGVSISVNPVNDAPVPDSNEINVNEESTGTPLGLSTPTDNDGDSLTIIVTGLPLLGEVTLANGSAISNGQTLSAVQLTGLQYNAPDEYNGSDPVGNFTYSVDDGQGEANSVQSGGVLITVNPVNDAPNTNPASGQGDEDNDINVELSGSDIDGSIDYFVIKSLPVNGILKRADGTELNVGDTVAASSDTATVVFEPDNNWYGETTFTYAALDNGNGEDLTPATATITVNEVNDPPRARNDTYGEVNEDDTWERNAANGVIGQNDFDPDGDPLTVTGIRTNDGLQGTVGQALTGQYGTLILNTDGSFTYVADQSAADALEEDDTADDIFYYTVSDGLDTDTARLKFEVVGTDQSSDLKASVKLAEDTADPDDNSTSNAGLVVTVNTKPLDADDFIQDSNYKVEFSLDNGVTWSDKYEPAVGQIHNVRVRVTDPTGEESVISNSQQLDYQQPESTNVITVDNYNSVDQGFSVTGGKYKGTPNNKINYAGANIRDTNAEGSSGFGVNGLGGNAHRAETTYDRNSGFTEELIVNFENDVSQATVKFLWHGDGGGNPNHAESAILILYRDGQQVGEFRSSEYFDDQGRFIIKKNPAITVQAEDGGFFDQIVLFPPKTSPDYRDSENQVNDHNNDWLVEEIRYIEAQGPDKIIGDDKDNILVGGSEAEILEGKEGNDQLIGHGGSDTFVFNIDDLLGSGTIQTDTITDFTLQSENPAGADKDKLDLSDLVSVEDNLTDPQQIVAALQTEGVSVEFREDDTILHFEDPDPVPVKGELNIVLKGHDSDVWNDQNEVLLELVSNGQLIV